MKASDGMQNEQVRKLIRFQPSQRPILIVVVDTEEEFDWSEDFSRSATSIKAMREIHRFQEVCDEFGIRPTYMTTYPVASQRNGIEPLEQIYRSGLCEIGVHLHPWVSPPFQETLSTYNSYPGNLDPHLESEKLRVLAEAIAQAFGVHPNIYKAGRYGFGPHTAEILLAQGFEIDLSASPPMDYREDGGPDYSSHPVQPYWFGDDRRLLGIPATGAYVGRLSRGADALYKWSSKGVPRRLRLPGVLARLGLLDRLRLSPEGFTLSENLKLSTSLFRRGVRVFQFTLHSPSLLPNVTPYVRSEEGRDRLLDLCGRFFAWFLGDFGGTAMTPTELKAHILRVQTSDQS